MRIKVPSEISNYEPSYLSSDCFLNTSKNVSSYEVKCRNDECNSKSYKTRYKMVLILLKENYVLIVDIVLQREI